MTLKQKRKLKNIIATVIAYTIMMIAIFIKCLMPAITLILIIVGLHITYEQFRQAMIVTSIIGALIAVIKLFKENERRK